jgi:hypothetical protein
MERWIHNWRAKLCEDERISFTGLRSLAMKLSSLVLMLALLPAFSRADDAAAIRALREQSNLGLLNHQIEPVLASLAENASLVAGASGNAYVGKARIKEVYLKSFADPEFGTYVRQIGEITLADDGKRAAERGTWIAIFNGKNGGSLISGDYLAHWARHDGKWTDMAEVYVALHCSGPKC